LKNLLNVVVVSSFVVAVTAWGNIPEKEPIFKQVRSKRSGISLFGGAVDARQDWFNYDSDLDGLEGVSADLAYARFALDPKVADVVVAVIDSGVDVHHEDLQGKIWNNPGETGLDSNGQDKATNGVDDDANGYVDDVYGWNFIGGLDAEGNPTHIGAETLEMTRIFKHLSTLKDSGVELSPEEEALLAEVKEAITSERKVSSDRIIQVNQVLAQLGEAFTAIAKKVDFSFEELNLEKAQALDEGDSDVAAAKKTIIAIFNGIQRESVDILNQIIAYHENVLEVYLNTDFDPRSEIVGDDPSDFNDTDYGNNDVIGPDADHGTHVAGIIAADRNNLLGVRGIAEKVKIMALRVVPDGDERDKDVALSIRYAVNNGAKVINMSFGKAFSPDQAKVAEAIKYASDNGVLLVHAAGNDAKDNDLAPSFPNRVLNNGELAATWLDIGASASMRGPEMVADFSNYGDDTVDIFAPGYEIESTIPGNQYAVFSGTSMASPTVAGVATMILGYAPNLSGVELKDLLLSTGKQYAGLDVKLPGSDDLVPFSTLSMTGMVANVNSAIESLMGR